MLILFVAMGVFWLCMGGYVFAKVAAVRRGQVPDMMWKWHFAKPSRTRALYVWATVVIIMGLFLLVNGVAH